MWALCSRWIPKKQLCDCPNMCCRVAYHFIPIHYSIPMPLEPSIFLLLYICQNPFKLIYVCIYFCSNYKELFLYDSDASEERPPSERRPLHVICKGSSSSPSSLSGDQQERPRAGPKCSKERRATPYPIVSESVAREIVQADLLMSSETEHEVNSSQEAMQPMGNIHIFPFISEYFSNEFLSLFIALQVTHMLSVQSDDHQYQHRHQSVAILMMTPVIVIVSVFV